MEAIKVTGLILEIKDGSILLNTKDSADGLWYTPIGKCKSFIKAEHKGAEVEITVSNVEKRTFTFYKLITIVTGDKWLDRKIKEEVNGEDDDSKRYRAMCLSYAKDLVIAGKIEKHELYSKAEELEKYVRDGTY